MVEFSCEQCDYITKKRFNLERHTYLVHGSNENEVLTNVKNVTVFTENVTLFTENVTLFPKNVTLFKDNKKCERCGKTFSRSDYTKKHMETCKGPTIDSHTCEGCSKTFTHRNVIYKHKQICKKYIALEQRRSIRNFQEENTEYISYDFAKSCFDMGVFGIPAMLDKIYFDDEHPENHNVKLKSLNQSLASVYSNEKWVAQSLPHTIDRIIHNSAGIIISKRTSAGKPIDAELDLPNLNTLMNIPVENKKVLRERVKAILVDRREANTD